MTGHGKKLMYLATVAIAGALLGTTASAQLLTPQPPEDSFRLYVFDCGLLIYNRPEYYNLKRSEVSDTNMPVTCYLVKHPKGTLLFDTGLSDKLIGMPYYSNVLAGYGQIKFNTLRAQLADIGYVPEDIDYLVMSHWHFDHVGNANDFVQSEWLVYKNEWEEMFTDEAKAAFGDDDHPLPGYQNYSELENVEPHFIEGEYDVFGDGSVKVLPTPGHTAGHAALLVNLKNTGSVVLTGDLYHYTEEWTMDRMPDPEKTKGTPESRAYVEKVLQETEGQLWIGHSTDFFRQARKSPAWYD